MEEKIIELDNLLSVLQDTIHKPEDSLYRLIEDNFFFIVPLIAAQEKNRLGILGFIIA
ncbi:hypothetical protein JYU05_00740 [bacterium AH-315-P13]|nr:hypothetical protein [bacterium AH-315-P13]